MEGTIQHNIHTLVSNVTEMTQDFKELQRRMICIIGEVLMVTLLLFVSPISSIQKSTITVPVIVSLVTLCIIISLSVVSSREIQSYHDTKESFISKYHDTNGNPIYTSNIGEYLIDIEEFSNATTRFVKIYKIVNIANMITALIAFSMLFATIASMINI